MNDRTDRPTPIEREGAPDCLVEMATEWFQRPLSGQSDAMRAESIDEICVLIAQMRHRIRAKMDLEQLRWIDRATARLCEQTAGVRGYEGAVRLEIERRVVVSLLRYHEWREKFAPMVERSPAAGPSDGGEIHA